MLIYESCSFRGEIIYWNFLGQTAASGCEGLSFLSDVSETNWSVLVLSNHQHTLEMRTRLVAETSENLHIPTRVSVRENVIEMLIYIINMVIVRDIQE
jgi:hypothetical protein